MRTDPAATSLLKSLLEGAHLPAGIEGEVTLSASHSRSVAWADGKPSLQEFSESEGICLRVLERGRQGLVTSKSMEPSRMAAMAEEALAIARNTPFDAHRKLADAAEAPGADLPVDTNLFSRSLEEVRALLWELEKDILAVDPRIKKVIKLHYYEHAGLDGLVHSRRTPLLGRSSAISFAAEVLAEEGQETEVAWDYQARRFSSGINVKEVAVSVAKHAAESLGGKPLSSGKYAVVVHPRVGSQLLDLVSNALSAEAAQRGRSFFRGQLGKTVAASIVTLIDDPLRPDGIASARFDDEGTPHQVLSAVSGGILKDFFHDIRSASKEGRASNGHGIKGSLGAAPSPDSTNFYLQPGSSSLVDMLTSAPRVFLLKDVMGLHMADPITGEFSLGASGVLYENGLPAHPVRGVTIAGSIGAMLKEISAVGSDLIWAGSTGAPSFLLPQMTIAGN